MDEQRCNCPIKRSTGKQMILGVFANFSTIAPSMTLGFSAVAIPVLEKEFSNPQISWFASIASLATPLGCMFSGPLADRFGRKLAFLLVSSVSFLGWLAISIACYMNSTNYLLLMLGRILTGLSTGLCSVPATIYMAEVASPELRNVFTTWTSIFFSLGVLVVYFLGFLLKENLGLNAAVATALSCIGAIVTIFFIPESPSWLIGKNRLLEARTNMGQILDSDANGHEVESEIQTLLRASTKKIKTEKKSFVQQFLSKTKFLSLSYNLRPLMLVLIYFFFQQFAGIFVILFYAINIVENAGITVDSYSTIVIIAIIRIIGGIAASLASKRIGRRPLSIISGTSMGLCLLCLVAFLNLKENGIIKSNSMNMVPYVLIMLYFFTSCLGFLPIPFALSAEFFPTKIKGLASGLCGSTGYLFNFIAVKIYPMMVEQFGGKYVFALYGVTALAGTIFLAWFLPETKGKSINEIQTYFGKETEQDSNDGEQLKTKHLQIL